MIDKEAISSRELFGEPAHLIGEVDRPLIDDQFLERERHEERTERGKVTEEIRERR